VSEELAIGPGTTVRVVSHTDEALEVEARYAPDGAPPPPHLHPEQDELFEVVSGALRLRRSRDEQVIVGGDHLEVPRGTPHQMWNDRDKPAVVRWRTLPAGRTLERFRALARLQRGEVEDPAALLREYRDVIRLEG
jgi:quercetin dioxygenase-like cupin family protein